MMRWLRFGTRTLFGQLLFSYLLLILATVLLISLLFNRFVSQYFITYAEWERLDQAQKAVQVIAEQLEPWQRSSLASDLSTLAVSFDSQLWVIDRRGRLIVQSELQAAEPALSLSQEEFASVLEGNRVVKKSVDQQKQSMLVALPIRAKSADGDRLADDEAIVAALVMRSPASSVAASIRNVTQLIVNAILVAVFVAIVIGWTLSKRLLRPLDLMNRIALQVASGHFEERVPPVPPQTAHEIKQIIATFNYAVDQIEKFINQERALERMRRDFVANVSHEFKGPLTSIRGFLELIAENRLSESDRKKYMRLVLGELAHLNYLVEDLLDLSQLESGKVHLHREAIHPETLLHGVYEETVDWAAKKSIELVIDTPAQTPDGSGASPLPYVWVDRHRIRQVLQNLTQNALRHTPSGGRITLEAFVTDDNRAAIRVSDTGEGIPEADIEHIWDRFYKVDKAHTPTLDGSTGLGLAIVKQIIDLHGGTIFVDSKVGEGTNFTIILPTPPEVDTVPSPDDPHESCAVADTKTDTIQGADADESVAG